MNFQVETSSYCDLTCGYCPNKDMERPRAFMSDKVFDTILYQYVVPFRHLNAFCPPTFIPHKDGEILLNKNLPALLLKVATVVPDMKIDIYSHGLMLPKLATQGRDFVKFLGSLPNRGVRYLMSHHPRNHDGSINDYAPVVEYLAKVLLDPPKNIEFITVSHKSHWVTEGMQEAWRLCWAGLPITVHCNAALNPWTGRIQEEGTVRFNGCPYGDFGHWFFGVTGNVIACCLDLEEEIVLGNVLVDDPDDMFRRTAEFYADQRRRQENKQRPEHRVCDNCFGYNMSDLLQVGVKTA